MEILVLDDAEAVARKAAGFVADTLREAIAVRGLATLALSGGHTPARMLELLAGESIPWSKLHLFQTDDRMVPGDDAARNAGAIRRLLTDHVPLPPQRSVCEERRVNTMLSPATRGIGHSSCVFARSDQYRFW